MKSKSLKEFKESKGLSNRGMALLLGISEAHLSMLLSGQRALSRGLALRLSQKTGIPVLNLLYPQAESHEQPSV